MNCIDNEFNSIFLTLLFYFPECLDLGAIGPCGKTKIVHEFWDFSFIECICNDDGQSCTFEVFWCNNI